MSVFTDKAPWLMRRLMREFPGLTVEDAAAVFGNAGHESAGFTILQEIKPTVKGSRGGYGWFQWTGPRRRAFEAFCKVLNLRPSSDEANYGFLVEELRTTEKAAIAALQKAVGLEPKVIAFEKAYERAGVKHYPSRLKYAKQAFAAYQGTVVPPPPDIEPVEPKPADGPATSLIGAIIAALVGLAALFWSYITAFFNWLF